MYCGLCRSLSQEYGFIARFTLSYDFTFVAMLHGALQQTPPQVTPRRCPFNPIRKARPHLESCASILFACDAASLLLGEKVQDNLQDSGAIERVLWRCILPISRKFAEKAAQRQVGMGEAVFPLHTLQKQVEEQPEASLDHACNPTATVLGKILEQMGGEPAQQRILYRLGYMIGRFCYLCDAVDDFEKDLKSGGFNPLRPTYDQQRMHNLLYATAAEAASAYALLDIQHYKGILDNIIFLGLQATADRLIACGEDKL